MAIDSAPYIAGWNLNSPHVSDPRAEGANQIKAMKTAIHNCFPNVGGEVTADHTRMNQIFQAALPQVGMIMLFSGDTAPDGWAICDGSVHNSVLVPDLRGKFIMGATGEEPVGTSGNSNIETIKSDEFLLETKHLPPLKFNYDGYSSIKMADGGGPNNVPYAPVTKTTNSIGGGAKFQTTITDFDKRPAYYALAFIMFVGFA